MKLLLKAPAIDATTEIYITGDLVKIAADMTELAEKPRQFTPLYRRAAHLTRRGRAKQYLTGIAARSEPRAIS